MLLVFALSAMIALTLYQQLPRVAFEAQREKESLCIDHGEQYKRAVQLYVRKLGRYPQKMEDLDNTQNIRFLRKHYFDAMTGKEEWRLLHMGNNGKLTDSKINNDKDSNWHAGSITEFKSAMSSDASDFGPENTNVGLRKRPSDDSELPPIPGANPAPQTSDPPALAMNTNSNQNPPGALQLGQPGAQQPGQLGLQQPGQPGVQQPGQAGTNPDPNMANPRPATGVMNPTVPGLPPGMRNVGPMGASAYANQPAQPLQGAGGSVSGNGGFGSSGSISGNGGFGDPTRSVANSQSGTTQYATAPGSNQSANTGFGQPGQSTGGAGPAQMINNLLTQPRPGGMPQGVGGGAMVMGGLAGVASTYKGHAIRRYNEQDEYQKWEFFYDTTQDYGSRTPNMVNTLNPNQQQTPGMNNTNVNTGSSFGSGFGGNSNSFGGNSGNFGNSTGFGNNNSGGFGGTTQVPNTPVSPTR